MSYSVNVTYRTPSGNKTVGTNSSRVNAVTSNLQSQGYKIISIVGQGAGKNVVAPVKAAVPSAQVNKESTTIYEAGTPIGKELEAPAAPIEKEPLPMNTLTSTRTSSGEQYVRTEYTQTPEGILKTTTTTFNPSKLDSSVKEIPIAPRQKGILENIFTEIVANLGAFPELIAADINIYRYGGSTDPSKNWNTITTAWETGKEGTRTDIEKGDLVGVGERLLANPVITMGLMSGLGAGSTLLSQSKIGSQIAFNLPKIGSLSAGGGVTVAQYVQTGTAVLFAVPMTVSLIEAQQQGKLNDAIIGLAFQTPFMIGGYSMGRNLAKGYEMPQLEINTRGYAPKDYSGFVKPQGINARMGIGDDIFSVMKDTTEANRPRVIDWSKTDTPKLNTKLIGSTPNEMVMPEKTITPYSRIIYKPNADILVATREPLITGKESIGLTLEEQSANILRKYNIGKTEIKLSGSETLTESGYQKSLETLSMDINETERWSSPKVRTMSLSEFGEKAAIKLEQQRVAFDILNETNPSEAFKTLSIEGYDSKKWSRGFWNDINAQLGKNEREFEIIQRRPSKPISESTSFKKYSGTDEDIFYRSELKAPGKEKYWNNILINELDAGRNVGEGFRFRELPLLKIDAKMGEINIHKLNFGAFQENKSSTSQITLSLIGQIQIPMQLQLQQSLQLQQQEQAQLQLQQQEQIQIQVQQQQIKLQVPITITETVTMPDIDIPDIPIPNTEIIILPPIIPPPSKKKRPTFDIDTDIFVMEGYQFRHKAFPVVTSDFFRKVNIKLPKVKF